MASQSVQRSHLWTPTFKSPQCDSRNAVSLLNQTQTATKTETRTSTPFLGSPVVTKKSSLICSHYDFFLDNHSNIFPQKTSLGKLFRPTFYASLPSNRPRSYFARRRRIQKSSFLPKKDFSEEEECDVFQRKGSSASNSGCHHSQFSFKSQNPNCSERSEVNTVTDVTNSSSSSTDSTLNSASKSGEKIYPNSENSLNSNGITTEFPHVSGFNTLQNLKDDNDSVFDPLGVKKPSVNLMEEDKSSQKPQNEKPQISSKGGLSSLDAYFEKLNASKESKNLSSSSIAESLATKKDGNEGSKIFNGGNGENGGSSSKDVVLKPGNLNVENSGEPVPKAVKALRSLDSYFDKLRPPPPPSSPPSTVSEELKSPSSETPILLPDPKTEWEKTLQDIKKRNQEEYEKLSPELKTPEMKKMWEKIGSWVEDAEKNSNQKNTGEKSVVKNEKDDANGVRYEFQIGFNPEQTIYEKWEEKQIADAAPWVINLMIALDVAVYILELGSPELVPDNIMTSLPSLYMAKVNALIVAGEWWRLVTPSFLHSGFLHLLVSIWSLSQLGPRVEVALGPLGLLGAFVVGGAFGNLLSFEATEGITVGGTGPIYALAGAWVVYLFKNRESLGKEWADGEIWRVVFLAGLNVALGSPPPIDDWTHIGAAVGGAFYGLLAAPSIQTVSIFKKPPSNNNTINSNSPPEFGKDDEVWLVSEAPGTKQHFWIYLLCAGILVACYQGGIMAANGTIPGIGSQDIFI